MTGVRLQPSVLDRLDPIAAAIRWWTSEIAGLFGSFSRKVVTVEALDQKKRLPHKIAIMLGETDGFVARTRLPKGSSDAHRRALDLKAQDLAPIAPTALTIIATATERASDGSLTYAVAMARKDRLGVLETIARRKGARSVAFAVEHAADVELLSPAADRKSQRNLIIDAVIVLSVIVSGMVAVSSWTARIEAETAELAAQERSLRRAAVVAEAARKDAGISAQLIERGLLGRRADTALRTLALFNTATPDSAWWTRIRWTPQETTISGQAADATGAIKQMSNTAKGWSIELSGPLNAAPSGGFQTFELIARERKAPAQ